LPFLSFFGQADRIHYLPSLLLLSTPLSLSLFFNFLLHHYSLAAAAARVGRLTTTQYQHVKMSKWSGCTPIGFRVFVAKRNTERLTYQIVQNASGNPAAAKHLLTFTRAKFAQKPRGGLCCQTLERFRN
jgi:hypothetical protein